MIAVVSAVRDEVADYLGYGDFRASTYAGGVRIYRSRSSPNVAVAVGGIGRDRAVATTEAAIEAVQPSMIFCTGFAGGVQEELEPGDLTVCERVWRPEGPPEAWSADSATSIAVAEGDLTDRLLADLEQEGLRAVKGDCLTVPKVVSGQADKDRIGREFPVATIDMESFWVAATAAEHGVSTTVVRAVLDPLHLPLPPFVKKVAEDGGRGRWRHALGYLLAGPWRVGSLIQLSAQVRVARASLASLLRVSTSMGRHTVVA